MEILVMSGNTKSQLDDWLEPYRNNRKIRLLTDSRLLREIPNTGSKREIDSLCVLDSDKHVILSKCFGVVIFKNKVTELVCLNYIQKVTFIY